MCCCLAAYLVMAAGGGTHTVICIGDDGHMAIEVADGDCCGVPCETTFEHASNGAGKQMISESNEGCGECTDIPISTCHTSRYPAPSPTKLVKAHASMPQQPAEKAMDFRCRCDCLASSYGGQSELGFVNTFVLQV